MENGLHYRRGVTLGEDASGIRKGVAPQVMAAPRNGVLQVLSAVAAPSLAAALRTRSNCFGKALHLPGLPHPK